MTLPYVYGIGLSLVFFVMVANLVLHQYGHGAMRAVADEAARAGARTTTTVSDAVGACERTAERRRDGLLNDRLAREPEVVCTVVGGRLAVTVEATFPGWLPFVPDWRPVVSASALWEGQR